jgi:hypothetical protein
MVSRVLVGVELKKFNESLSQSVDSERRNRGIPRGSATAFSECVRIMGERGLVSFTTLKGDEFADPDSGRKETGSP